MQESSLWRSCQQVILLPLLISPKRVQKDDAWRNAISHLVIFCLTLIGFPLRVFGDLLQWFLNFYSTNGGSFFKILSTFLLEWKPNLPHCESDEYLYSVIGFLDPRFELTDPTSDRFYQLNSKECAELCIMAAKLAYETEGVQKRVVNKQWNMCFHNYYSCKNARSSEDTTEAFIFKDRSRDAKLIVLAFRGTEPFNAQDWATDFDFGWYRPQFEVGAIHVGFLEALGVQSRTNLKPLEMRAQSDLNYAFSVISRDLGNLVLHNPDAQLIITGHSLGGALALLFAGIMIYLHGTHDKGAQKVLQSLKAIYTFGQPRVGDQIFADYLTRSLEEYGIEYHRVVYSYDLVPRVPFDDTVFGFKHAGRMCNYYNAFYAEKGLRMEPDTNFFDVIFFITAHITAVVELCNGLLFNRLIEGDWYSETTLMLIARITGLFLPGLTGHSPTNYVNAIRMGPETLSTAIKH